MVLHVDLQEGFSHDTVTVLVDGRQVFRKQNVSTNPSAGLAATAKATTDGDLAEVEIQVATRSTSDAKELDLQEFPYVGISLDADGKPRITPSREAFQYLSRRGRG
jgi:hypothetical protein